ncbi:MAG: DmsC/YnfH family molybdoenzyme membrane anchor subunit [Planctomycetota bacterium]
MSGTLPVTSSVSSDFALPIGSGEGESCDLVELLLAEQQSLTAVEDFSAAHDQMEAAAEDLPAQAKYYKKLMPATAPDPDQQFAFEVDLDACSGCKACVVACHTMNGLEENESWRKVGSLVVGQPDEPEDLQGPSTIQVEPGVQHVTTACHHCEEPGCLHGCPVKAYDKDPVTGIVRHLDDQCIGCKYCTMMCPYEVPKYSKRLGIVRKCDMCHNRLAADEAPACVQSCPNEAIRISIVPRKGEKPDDEARLAPGAPLSSITRPTTTYSSTRANDFGLPNDAGIDEVAESHWPLAALLIGTQISVGMLICERGLALASWAMAGRFGTEMVPWPSPQVSAVVVTAALVTAMAGLNLAPLHLGQPLRAWRVFLGLRTSWLSREAVILGKYVGALHLAVGLLWLPLIQGWLPTWVNELVESYVPSWAAAATLVACLPIGLAGLYSSAMIYIATKRPLWRHARTLPRFGGTTMIGGVVFAAASISATLWWDAASAGILGRSLAIFIAGTAIGLAFKLWREWVESLGPVRPFDHPHDRRSRKLISRKLSSVRTARLVAGGAGVIALTVGAFAAWILGLSALSTVLMLGFASVAVLVGESIERYLYFTSVVYDRMPGTLR